MARYDLYQFNGGLVVDLQNDLIDIPGSRIVAPLLKASSAPRPTKNLHPVVDVDGVAHVVAIHLLAATPMGELNRKVGRMDFSADALTRALDLLFQGY